MACHYDGRSWIVLGYVPHPPLVVYLEPSKRLRVHWWLTSLLSSSLNKARTATHLLRLCWRDAAEPGGRRGAEQVSLELHAVLGGGDGILCPAPDPAENGGSHAPARSGGARAVPPARGPVPRAAARGREALPGRGSCTHSGQVRFAGSFAGFAGSFAGFAVSLVGFTGSWAGSSQVRGHCRTLRGQMRGQHSVSRACSRAGGLQLCVLSKIGKSFAGSFAGNSQLRGQCRRSHGQLRGLRRQLRGLRGQSRKGSRSEYAIHVPGSIASPAARGGDRQAGDRRSKVRCRAR